ncbi:hypothetical protein [Aurantimonas coralicida]|uniref:hypothetical protein n=1 Tax=Aurantimonas coralicida TaxID=182270 RepID=UPI00238AF36C|nr:hypothetical protein [Aurantimonas coralicida]MDE0925291.1 hypothetical protein [Aurantimonas coralicida]
MLRENRGNLFDGSVGSAWPEIVRQGGADMDNSDESPRERSRNHAAIGWLAVIVTLAAIGAFVLAEGSGDPSDGLQPGAAAPAPTEQAQ